jgi:hypothetical protein
MTKEMWAEKFYINMKAALIECGFFVDQEEANFCLEFHADLNGDGPAIIKNAGGFEMLGQDVCIDMDRGQYITIENPNDDFYMEVVNAELMKPYAI